MIYTFIELEKYRIVHRDLKPENILLKFDEESDTLEKTIFTLCDFSEAS